MPIDRIRGALLGGLLGDAFGSVLEGTSVTDPRLEALLTRRAAERKPWRYTDDTALALGLARSLIERGGLDEAHLMDTWSDAYEPARGYGRGMKLALRAWRAGEAPAHAAWRDGSNGSGAAARVLAVACLFQDDGPALVDAARRTAALTHGGEAGLEGCVLFARALAASLRLPERTPIDPLSFVSALGSDWLGPVPGLLAAPLPEVVSALGNGVTADEAVPLAILAFLRWSPGFDDVVVNAARCGGDVDTIAAMSGALAGARVGASKLPRLWLENAEGVAEATQLADALFVLRSGRI